MVRPFEEATNSRFDSGLLLLRFKFQPHHWSFLDVASFKTGFHLTQNADDPRSGYVAEDNPNS